MVPERLEPYTEFRSVLPDGVGGLALIDIMGDDAAVVRAARTSYGKGTKRVSSDRGLIRYLLSHKHTTPFEMCEIVIFAKMPIDVARQWIRHRTASVNEYSTRYSEALDEIAFTAPDSWRRQATSNKQGSHGYLPLEHGAILSNEERELHEHAKRVYSKRIYYDVAKEQARKDLPLSNYTQWYWKIDLHNCMNFLRLRMDSHAQQEIRAYANLLGEIVSLWVPDTWEAFNDYVLEAETFSRMEMLLLKKFLGSGTPPREVFEQLCATNGMNKREAAAFWSKLGN